MIIKCARTGIEFETDSKRQKNHPAISSILSELGNDKSTTGGYRAACAACAAIKQDGGYTIEEAVDFIRQAAQDGAVPRQSSTRGDALRERKARSAERERVNSILRQHGYTWSREDEESMDIFGATAFEAAYGSAAAVAWTLWSPDNRAVSVAEALREIEAK